MLGGFLSLGKILPIATKPTARTDAVGIRFAKRATQINNDIKKELLEKLDEFATFNDSLEEVFENKEQIEVSKFYEKLPKSTAIAVEEWLENRVYHRNPQED